MKNCFNLPFVGLPEMHIDPPQSVESKQVESVALNEGRVEVSDVDHDVGFHDEPASPHGQTFKLEYSDHSYSKPAPNLPPLSNPLSHIVECSTVSSSCSAVFSAPECSGFQPTQTIPACSVSLESSSEPSKMPVPSSSPVDSCLGPSVNESSELPRVLSPNDSVPDSVPRESVPEMNHEQSDRAHERVHEGFFNFGLRGVFEANVSFSIQFRDLRNS